MMVQNFLYESCKISSPLFAFFVRLIPLMGDVNMVELDNVVIEICINENIWDQKNKEILNKWIENRKNHTNRLYMHVFRAYIKSQNHVLPILDFLDLAESEQVMNFEGFAEPTLLDAMFTHLRAKELIQFFTRTRDNLSKDLVILITRKAIESRKWNLISILLKKSRNFELLVLKVTIVLMVIAVFGHCLLCFLNDESTLMLLACVSRLFSILGILSMNMFDMHRLKKYCSKIPEKVSKYLPIFSEASHRLILMVSSINDDTNVWMFRAVLFFVLLNEKLQKPNDYLWYKIFDNILTILVYFLLSINILTC